MDTLNNLQQDSVSFIADPNFDQFIDLIRGENDCFIDNQLLSCPAFNNANLNIVHDPSSTTISSLFPCFEGGEVKGGGTNSNSATSTTNTNKTTTIDAKPSKVKINRSKALISERRRRGTMKDKLYALRALVPNITKMDKASIIGDATSYVYDLQAQAKKLKAEIAELEASLTMSENYQEILVNNNVQAVTQNNRPICKKIIQIEMVQVEERGFYTKILCKKEERVAPSLYKALESLTDFSVQNSNLTTICDNYLLTFILNVKGCDQLEINLPNLKLWVASALLNQGFEFMQFFHA